MIYENPELKKELLKASRMNSNELKCALIGMNVLFKKGLQPQNYYKSIYIEELKKKYERFNIMISQENSLEQSPTNKSMNSSCKNSQDKSKLSQHMDVVSILSSEKKNQFSGNLAFSSYKGNISNSVFPSVKKQSSSKADESFNFRDEYNKQNSNTKQSEISEWHNISQHSPIRQFNSSIKPSQQNQFRNLFKQEYLFENSIQKNNQEESTHKDYKNIFQLNEQNKYSQLKSQTKQQDKQYKQFKSSEEQYSSNSTSTSPQFEESVNNFDFNMSSRQISSSRNSLQLKQSIVQEVNEMQDNLTQSQKTLSQRQSLSFDIPCIQQSHIQQNTNFIYDTTQQSQINLTSQQKLQGGLNQDSIFNMIDINDNTLKTDIITQDKLQKQIHISSLKKQQETASIKSLNNSYQRLSIENNINNDHQNNSKKSSICKQDIINTENCNLQSLEKKNVEILQKLPYQINEKQQQMLRRFTNQYRNEMMRNLDRDRDENQFNKMRETKTNQNVDVIDSNNILKIIQKVLLVLLGITICVILYKTLNSGEKVSIIQENADIMQITKQRFSNELQQAYEDNYFYIKELKIRGIFGLEDQSKLLIQILFQYIIMKLLSISGIFINYNHINLIINNILQVDSTNINVLFNIVNDFYIELKKFMKQNGNQISFTYLEEKLMALCGKQQLNLYLDKLKRIILIKGEIYETLNNKSQSVYMLK